MSNFMLAIKFLLGSIIDILPLWGAPLVFSFAVTLAIGPTLIPWLHKLKFGQEIREEGPPWHQKKSGTPTMGGIMFIAGTAASVTLSIMIGIIGYKFEIGYFINLIMMLVISMGFGLIGFIDDYIKVVKHRNLGLTAPQKFIMQCVLAVIYIVVLKIAGELDTEMIIPFLNFTVTMPWWLYIPFILIVVTGTVNAVNLTDGLDGLAASVTVVTSLFFGLMGIVGTSGSVDTPVFGAAIAGGCLGFLIFNHYPARVFMGDTGSLFLGGAISVMAVGARMPLLIIIAGFVYLFEALSVIIQVTSFKLTGKRVFKMSPIHHHFEMCGWKETKIVFVFTLTTVILCIAASISLMPYMMLFNSF